jgi:hypothetical protein
MGMMTHLPCCPAMLSGSTLLRCGLVPTPSECDVVQLGWQKALGPSMPHTIPCMGFKWQVSFSPWYKWREARCGTAHLAISNSSELDQKSPFLATDLEARSAPLHVMANWGDHSKHPWGGIPHRDGHLSLSHRAWMDPSSSQALPSVRWGFTPRRCLPGLASCCDASFRFLIGVGILLLEMQWSRWRWPLSCRGNSLPRRGS